jgi:acyl-coenzyme A thioesterase PaaI-like protein
MFFRELTMNEDVKLEALHSDWQAVELPFSRLVHSFVSGDPEGRRIRIRYFRGKEEGMLWGRVWFGPEAEGPPGHAHGGAQAAVLDEICGGTAWVFGHKVVAVQLQTEFVHFVPLNTELLIQARIIKSEGRKIYTEGRIEDGRGQVLARGQVLFLELSADSVSRLSFSLPT